MTPEEWDAVVSRLDPRRVLDRIGETLARLISLRPRLPVNAPGLSRDVAQGQQAA